ncbi:MAG: hypothetical protein PHO64_07375 [Thiomonas sp.]|nr:hypothetical protein [Thiomonas sp.]
MSVSGDVEIPVATLQSKVFRRLDLKFKVSRSPDSGFLAQNWHSDLENKKPQGSAAFATS